MTYADAVDRLITRLETAAPEIRWDRDALDMGATETTGAVEMTGEVASDWADGKPVDANFGADIWILTADSGYGLLGRITQALMAYDDLDGLITWSQPERHFLYDLGKIGWKWTVIFWEPLETEETDEETEPDG